MWVKCIYVILLLIYFPVNPQNNTRECIEGEEWYERCKHCKCLKNNSFTCKRHRESCSLGKMNCRENIVSFDEKFRCHCTQNISICVPLQYQNDLDGSPCSEDYYLYDTCTFCACDMDTKKMSCNSLGNCELLHGGICNEGEEIAEANCYKCGCTFTKFRKCFPSLDCRSRKEKPGYCYKMQNFYDGLTKHSCLSSFEQECYTDYGCPGQKKCCRVVDCFLRCVDPIFI